MYTHTHAMSMYAPVHTWGQCVHQYARGLSVCISTHVGSVCAPVRTGVSVCTSTHVGSVCAPVLTWGQCAYLFTIFIYLTHVTMLLIIDGNISELWRGPTRICNQDLIREMDMAIKVTAVVLLQFD